MKEEKRFRSETKSEHFKIHFVITHSLGRTHVTYRRSFIDVWMVM